MSIKVKERFYPFSHQPGTKLIIPKTKREVQIFPTKLIYAEGAFFFPQKIPVEGFTVIQDLEKCEVRIFGKGENFVEYRLYKEKEKIILKEKGKDPFFLCADETASFVPSSERLSFGVHKKQKWEGILERSALEEILPFWFRLSHTLPLSTGPKVGTAQLLDSLEAYIKKREIFLVEKTFKNLLRAAFTGLLCPRLMDLDFQGILEEEVVDHKEASFLISGLGRLIKSLFFQEEGKEIHILPCLLPCLHAGRFVHIKTHWGEIDLEWSKKTVRRLLLRPEKKQTLLFSFPSSIKRFRLCTNHQKKKITKGEEIFLEKDQVCLLDCFEK